MIHLEKCCKFAVYIRMQNNCHENEKTCVANVSAEWFVSGRLVRRLTITPRSFEAWVLLAAAGEPSTRMPTSELVIFPSAIAANTSVINGRFGDLGINSCPGSPRDLRGASECVKLTPSQHLARFAANPSSHASTEESRALR